MGAVDGAATAPQAPRRFRGVVGIPLARGRRSRQGEEGAGLVERRAKRRRAQAMADDVEEVAVLARRGVGEFPRRAGAGEADVERAPAGAVEVARDPVAALAAPVRQVLPADGLGAARELGGDGGGIHGASPVGGKNGFGMAGLLGAWRERPDTGQPRLSPAPEGQAPRAKRGRAARTGMDSGRPAKGGSGADAPPPCRLPCHS